MEVKIDVSDDLALRLSSQRERLPDILELGLRELNADVRSGFSGLAELLEFLATLPSLEEILALRPSDQLQEEIDRLLEKNQVGGLSDQEELLWQQYEYVEHLVRMAKTRALIRLKDA